MLSERHLSVDELRDRIVKLDADDTVWRRKELAHRELAASELEEIKWELDELKQRYGDDSDLKDLETMYADLRGDYEKGGKLNLDSSLGAIAGEVYREMEQTGIQALHPNQVPPGDLQELAQRLADFGMSVEYVVAANQANAPTLILMPQSHASLGMSEGIKAIAGVTANQAEIKSVLVQLSEAGLTHNSFIEGLAAGTELTLKSAKLNPDQGMALAKRDLATNLTVYGFDNLQFLRKTLVESTDPVAVLLRQTAGNIYLADALKRQIDHLDIQLSTAVIGAGHELNIETGEMHSFSLSKIVAYLGINVIVVNRPEFDTARLAEYSNSHPEELKEISEKTSSAASKL
jgi:hypothetical protein